MIGPYLSSIKFQPIITYNSEPSVAIYPHVENDGIGSYVEALSKTLGVETVKSRYKLLSPFQLLENLPPAQLVHVPHCVVPLAKQNRLVVCTIQDISPLLVDCGLNRIQIEYLRARIRISLRNSNMVIFTSRSAKRDTEKLFGRLNASTIIPLAPKCVFDPVDLNKEPVLQFQYFLMVGRRNKHKNVMSVIRAIARLRHEDCHLVLAGHIDPVVDRPILTLVRELGIEHRVHFEGKVSQGKLMVLFKNAIALVYPSFYEGFGLPILEAMQYGCPVITSNAASMPEVAGGAAILINPHSVESIYKAMLLTYKDNTIRKNLIEAGIIRASSFSWKSTAKSTMEVYNSLL